MRCPICEDLDVTYAFLCREGVHVGSCSRCLIHLRSCPFCRDPLRSTRVFLYPSAGDVGSGPEPPPAPALSADSPPPFPPPLPSPPPPPPSPPPAAVASPVPTETVPVIGVTIKRVRPIYSPGHSMLELDVKIPAALRNRLRRRGLHIQIDGVSTVQCFPGSTTILPSGGRITAGAYINLELVRHPITGPLAVVHTVRICYPGVN